MAKYKWRTLSHDCVLSNLCGVLRGCGQNLTSDIHSHTYMHQTESFNLSGSSQQITSHDWRILSGNCFIQDLSRLRL